MVVMDDCLPVGEDGSVSVASSAEPLELWPSLIAKAVYLVYTKCGFSLTDTLAPTTADGDNTDALLQRESGVLARRSAHFVSFALSSLTGWLPGAPWSPQDIAARSEDVLRGLLGDIISGGAALLTDADIPSMQFYTPENPLGESAEAMTEGPAENSEKAEDANETESSLRFASRVRKVSSEGSALHILTCFYVQVELGQAKKQVDNSDMVKYKRMYEEAQQELDNVSAEVEVLNDK